MKYWDVCVEMSSVIDITVEARTKEEAKRLGLLEAERKYLDSDENEEYSYHSSPYLSISSVQEYQQPWIDRSHSPRKEEG